MLILALLYTPILRQTPRYHRKYSPYSEPYCLTKTCSKEGGKGGGKGSIESEGRRKKETGKRTISEHRGGGGLEINTEAWGGWENTPPSTPENSDNYDMVRGDMGLTKRKGETEGKRTFVDKVMRMRGVRRRVGRIMRRWRERKIGVAG